MYVFSFCCKLAKYIIITATEMFTVLVLEYFYFLPFIKYIPVDNRSSHDGEGVNIVVVGCETVNRYQRSEEHAYSIFRAEGGDSMFIRNINIFIRVHTATQARRKISSCFS